MSTNPDLIPDSIKEEESDIPSTSQLYQHVNLFGDLEKKQKSAGNSEGKFEPHPEREAEKKVLEDRENRRWTTYLGQSSVEMQKVKPWYLQNSVEELPDYKRRKIEKRKDEVDPINDLNKFLATKKALEAPQATKKPSTNKVKKRENKSNKKHKKLSMKEEWAKLRQDRQKREEEERKRVEGENKGTETNRRNSYPPPRRNYPGSERNHRYNSGYNVSTLHIERGGAKLRSDY